MRNVYREGSVFLVPLPEGGFARGVVARAAPKGKVLCGYFFGPRLDTPQGSRLDDLHPEQAVLYLRFGDLGLINGSWRIVGEVPNWNPAEWPVQDAVRRDLLGKAKPILTRYVDSDPSKILSETVLEHDIDLPTDGLAGYGFAEAKLASLLG